MGRVKVFFPLCRSAESVVGHGTFPWETRRGPVSRPRRKEDINPPLAARIRAIGERSGSARFRRVSSGIRNERERATVKRCHSTGPSLFSFISSPFAFPLLVRALTPLRSPSSRVTARHAARFYASGSLVKKLFAPCCSHRYGCPRMSYANWMYDNRRL